MSYTLSPIKSSLRKKIVIGFIVFVSIPLLFFEFVLFRSWLGTTRDIVVHQYETILDDSTNELRSQITTMERMNDYIYRDFQQDTLFYNKLKGYQDGSSLRNDPYLNAVFTQLSNQFFAQHSDEMIFSYFTLEGDLIYQRSNRAGNVHFLSLLSLYEEEAWFQQITENGPVNTVLTAHRSMFLYDNESIYFSFGQVIRSPIDLQPVGVSLLTVNAVIFERLLKSPADQKLIKTIVTDQDNQLMFTNDPTEPLTNNTAYMYNNILEPYNWVIKAYLSSEQLSQSYRVPMIQNNGLFVIGNIILLAAIIGFLSRQLKPLYLLAEKMKKAKEGHFYVKIGKVSNDELGMLSEGFNDMTTEIQRLFENQKTEYQEKLQFQMKALETQINPHFIYNMLDLIQCRVFDAKPDEASELIVSLSVIMRYTTTRPGEKVKFEEELKWLKDYIFLQQQLIGRTIHVHLDIQEEVMTCKVHKLILQPIIENVFLHGFEFEQDSYELLIRGYWEGEWLCFQIVDNGKGFSSPIQMELIRGNVDELKEWGTGLYVTAQRFLLQSEYAVIYIQSIPGEGTRVTMKQIMCD